MTWRCLRPSGVNRRAAIQQSYVCVVYACERGVGAKGEGVLSVVLVRRRCCGARHAGALRLGWASRVQESVRDTDGVQCQLLLAMQRVNSCAFMFYFEGSVML